MKIAIVTDAWHPQVNGVVTTMSTVVNRLVHAGHEIDVIEPSGFRTIACPGYPEIRLSIDTRRVRERLRTFRPDSVHVVTEGPLGWAAIRFLQDSRWAHTTSMHTRFPEYLQARVPIMPLSGAYALLSRFHRDSSAVLVPTPSMARLLTERGFGNLRVWGRGVDTTLFTPDAAVDRPWPRPIHLYVGRISVEKNIEAFLGLQSSGTKVVVGDGPQRRKLERAHPDAIFTGYRHGRRLARMYASADVFVFPSRSDTFGIVMLEAMACGTPVAAYPVTGPIDVVRPGITGVLDESLERAVEGALMLDRQACWAAAREHDWDAVAVQFLDTLVPAVPDRVNRAA